MPTPILAPSSYEDEEPLMVVDVCEGARADVGWIEDQTEPVPPEVVLVVGNAALPSTAFSLRSHFAILVRP